MIGNAMAERQTFVFVIGDAKVKPRDVAWADLAAALDALEGAILAAAKIDRKRLGKKRPVIALTGIEVGSDALVSEAPSELMPAIQEVAESVATGRYETLPFSAQQEMFELHRLLTPKYREWGFNENRALGIRRGRVSAAAPVAAPREPVYLQSTTTIYGYLYSAGGKTAPRLSLDVAGREVKVEVPRELARTAGARLYSTVGLEGVAFWRTDTLEVEKFRANRVLEYSEVDALAGFERLAEIAGPSLAKVDLVAHFAAGGDEDEA